MTEKEDNMSAVGNNENSPHDLMSEIQKLRSEIFDKLDKQTDESKQKLTQILEKLQSAEDFVSENHSNTVFETKNAVAPPTGSSCLSLTNPTAKVLEIGKSFVLKHDFKSVENFEKDARNFSELEEHFGAKWCINLKHMDNNLAFYLHVEHPGENWEIGTKFDLIIIGPNKTNLTRFFHYCFKGNTGYGCHMFLEWEELKKNYLVDGKLTAEAHVKIIETKGLGKEKFRSFDESVKEVSDIVLVVKDRRFYVLKKYFAVQSSFFKALLLGSFAESKKSEVTLTGIDPEDFHFFLEVLYGELAIDESNVEGIALLADMYDAPTVIRRCEDFLKNDTKKSLKKKLQMATSYNLEGLKKQCLDNITTADEIRSVVPTDIQELDPTVTTDLLKKALSLLT